MNDDLVISASGIVKSFAEGGGGKLTVLDGVDFSLAPRESCAVVGNSGSGKSTLLEILATLLFPDRGRILFKGRDVSTLGEKEIATLRNRDMGFIFQNALLLSDFTARENVMMPALIKGSSRSEAEAEADRLLSLVGLSERSGHLPGQLSGGEKQRVAVARALVNRPAVVFADEPTGALDEERARGVEDLLLSVTENEGASLLLVTHNKAFASRCGRVLLLHDRKLAPYA